MCHVLNDATFNPNTGTQSANPNGTYLAGPLYSNAITMAFVATSASVRFIPTTAAISSSG